MDLRARYLDLVKRAIGDFIYYLDELLLRNNVEENKPWMYTDMRTGQKHILDNYWDLKEHGLTQALYQHSIIGWKRMNQLQEAVETVIREKIPGDLIETGVFRGGACVLMRAVLEAYEDRERKVFVADSFQGFPLEALRARGIANPKEMQQSVPDLDEVKKVFEIYHLLDDQVVFLPGWFSDTLPEAEIDQLAVLRLDSDFYESTWECLEMLYPKVSPGGFVIVDDYYAFDECRAAVKEYRKAHQIQDYVERIDAVGVYWRKSS